MTSTYLRADKLVSVGDAFGTEKRASNRPGIEFGLQYTPFLHKLIKKLFKLAEVQNPPKLQVDKFFGTNLAKTDTNIYNQNIYQKLEHFYVASIFFTKESIYDEDSAIVGMNEYNTFYFRMVQGVQYVIAKAKKEQSDESFDSHDSELKILTKTVKKAFAGLDEMFIENCFVSDWQNDKDNMSDTISKSRFLSMLNELVVHSLIGRCRASPSKVRETLTLLFFHSFPEYKDSETDLQSVIINRKKKTAQRIRDIYDFKDPWKAKCKRKYKRPWSVCIKSQEATLNAKLNQTLRRQSAKGSGLSGENVLTMFNGDTFLHSWQKRRVESIKKIKNVGTKKSIHSIQRSGGRTSANERLETYLIKEHGKLSDEALLMLPPPFRPTNSGKTWEVAFGRSRLLTPVSMKHGLSSNLEKRENADVTCVEHYRLFNTPY